MAEDWLSIISAEKDAEIAKWKAAYNASRANEERLQKQLDEAHAEMSRLSLAVTFSRNTANKVASMQALDIAGRLREATTDQPGVAPCGHPASLTLRSAETGEPLYCEACDDKSGRRDAELREVELSCAAANEADELLRAIDLDPERYRTEAGFLNLPKIKAALAHPDQYPRLSHRAADKSPPYPMCHHGYIGGCPKCTADKSTSAERPEAAPR